MLRRDAKGVESLPVTLLLGIVLASFTLGIGLKCLDDASKFNQRQRAVESFNTFIEKARVVSLGCIGSAQHVELELTGGKIVVDGNFAQLVIDNRVLRSEVLPLPFWSRGKLEVMDGSYSIELQRVTGGGYSLKLWRP